jgi:hypothetical protein
MASAYRLSVDARRAVPRLALAVVVAPLRFRLACNIGWFFPYFFAIAARTVLYEPRVSGLAE